MRRDNVIAIDFDGVIYDAKARTLVPGAAEGIRKLHVHGYILVLWTCRTGNRLSNALNILQKYYLRDCFTAINETPVCVPYKVSCKVCAAWYIDDRNIGGFIGWDKVMELLIGREV